MKHIMVSRRKSNSNGPNLNQVLIHATKVVLRSKYNLAIVINFCLKKNC